MSEMLCGNTTNQRKKTMARVLVACEYSGRVRRAFAALGHDVLSADFEPAEDSSPYHYRGDCFDLIADQQFDLMIAHPPCTFLSVSGMHWTTRGLRDPKLTEDALAFVQRLMAAPIATTPAPPAMRPRCKSTNAKIISPASSAFTCVF